MEKVTKACSQRLRLLERTHFIIIKNESFYSLNCHSVFALSHRAVRNCGIRVTALPLSVLMPLNFPPMLAASCPDLLRQIIRQIMLWLEKSVQHGTNCPFSSSASSEQACPQSTNLSLSCESCSWSGQCLLKTSLECKS